jgi:hypothetical protein
VATDLCQLSDVRALLTKATADTAQDAVISSLITRASKLIMNEVDREFVTAGTNPQTRRTQVENAVVNLAPWDLQSATTVTFNPESTSPSTLVANQDYVLLPVKAPNGVYTALQLSKSLSVAASRTAQAFDLALLDITGNWGFPAIPADIVQACAIAVVIWMRREVQAFATTFNLDEGRLDRPEALPRAVARMLDNYARPIF